MSEQNLVEKFIKTIDAKPSNTKKPFAIGFVGLNGVGKSFVAQKISEKLGLYVANNDKIRRFLNENGIEGSSPAQELVLKIGPISSGYLYENKISHIIDADLMQFHEIAKKNAEKSGAVLYIVNLVCPEETILKRLDKRMMEIQKNPDVNLSRVGREEYFKRKELHSSLTLPEIFFTIDTSKKVDSQIDNLINKLRGSGVL